MINKNKWLHTTEDNCATCVFADESHKKEGFGRQDDRKKVKAGFEPRSLEKKSCGIYSWLRGVIRVKSKNARSLNHEKPSLKFGSKAAGATDGRTDVRSPLWFFICIYVKTHNHTLRWMLKLIDRFIKSCQKCLQKKKKKILARPLWAIVEPQI